MRRQKEETRRANQKLLPGELRAVVSKEDLNAAEKRRILEAFVENDDALGLLLDFISNKHLKRPGEPPSTAPAPSPQMVAADTAAAAGLMGPAMRSGMPLPYSGSQQHNFRSTGGNSGSLIQNKINGPGGAGGPDGASQTIYSTQYQLYLQNLQNNKSKFSEGLQM